MSDEKKGAPSPLVGEGREGGAEEAARGADAPRPEGPPSPTPSPKEGGDAPYLAKRRLPTEEVRSVGSTSMLAKGAAGVYAIAALACFGIAGYMAFGENRPLFSVAVIAPAIGGVWFLLRLFMVARPPRHQATGDQ